MLQTETKICGEDLGLIQNEWTVLVSVHEGGGALDLEVAGGEESTMDVEIGRGVSSKRHESALPSTVTSTEYDFDDDDLSQGALLPAYAVAFGKENLKSKNTEAAKREPVPDFGAPGDYKNTIAYRRALPALLKRKPLIVSGRQSVASGGSERDVSEPKWNFPEYGTLPESDRGVGLAQSLKQWIELWIQDVQREVGPPIMLHELPPIIAVEMDLTKISWEDLDTCLVENLSAIPALSATGYEYEHASTPVRMDHESSSPASRSADVDALGTEGDRDSYVPDERFPGLASMVPLPYFSGTASDETTGSHHPGSSTISEHCI
jgi:hypothetical protein